MGQGRGGEFTGDGVPDLLALRHNLSSLEILAGDGVGGFTPAPESWVSLYRNIEIGDVNGDGLDDAVLWSIWGIEVRIGDGAGGLAHAQSLSLPLEGLLLRDLDGDGLPEIVAASPYETFVYLNRGPFGYGDAAYLESWGRPAAGDLDGDGAADLVLVRGGDASVYFGEDGVLPAGDADMVIAVGYGSTHPTGWPLGAAIADTDGDADADLVVAYEVESAFVHGRGLVRVFNNRLDLMAACAADFADPRGVLDLADIVAFVMLFSAGDPSADIDGSGLLDLDDLTGFVGLFLAGCP